MKEQGEDFRIPPGSLHENRPFQHGITDPLYPFGTPSGIADDADKSAIYESSYAGRVDRQRCMLIVRADTQARTKNELRNVIALLTEIQKENEHRSPSVSHVRPFDLGNIPSSYRVSITIGFGSSLFQDSEGVDRFGFAAMRPRDLKPMPEFPHDAFDARSAGHDFIVVVCSDSTYVNVAIGRFLADTFDRRYAERFEDPGGRAMLRVHSIETGFARPDTREFLRFDDGIENLRPGEGEEMERLVYVDESNGEPPWCLNGSYLVYRKVRENMPVWEFHLGSDPDEIQGAQEAAIGRRKQSGVPLSRSTTGTGSMTPVYPDPTDDADGELNAHIRKVQPRRPDPDLFGRNDLERRFLRRPYPYFDGLDDEGSVSNGLQFIAYMSSIQNQFEHVTNMWQMNSDFPVSGTGHDALYAKDVLSTVDGGYFFCPPAARDNEILAQALFEPRPTAPSSVPRLMGTLHEDVPA